MRAFLFRTAPLAFLLAVGLFVNGLSASGQEAVGRRPIETGPPIVTPYPPAHVDVRAPDSLTSTVPGSAPIVNTPSCCGGGSTDSAAGVSGSESGSGESEAAATPADNDALAESVVDTMLDALPIAAKQRSAE